MRNRIFIIVFFCIESTSQIFADTTSVVSDSTIKPAIPPTTIGPLGIDTMTGLVLYSAVILLAILILALWRKNIMKAVDNLPLDKS